MTNKEFEDVEVIDESTDEVIPYEYSITSYGADYPVDSLVQRLDREVIFVPSFQRSYVWSIKQASRFIESLLLGLPVPGIFLSKEPETGKLLVVDGQQRLKSLQFFYSGIFNGKEFTLRGVQTQFEGKTYKTLDEEDRLRLDDAIIHATIVRQDQPSDDESSIYYLFERLNTGGTQLQPQEIRASIFHGAFNDLLRDLSRLNSWQAIYGPPSNRLKDRELILRFFALFYRADKYQRPMKEFLNEYMGKNRHLQLQGRDTLTTTFNAVVDLISETLGKTAFRPERNLNAAVFDAVMVGVATRLQRGVLTNKQGFVDAYHRLLRNEVFLNACRTATSDEVNVKTRIDLATEAFRDLV